MANKPDNASRILATVPAIAAIGAAAGSALLPENVEKLRAFFLKPAECGAIAVYTTAVLAIVTAILFQLVLSARFNDRRGQRSEPAPVAMTAEPPASLSLTAEERALREREQHLFSIRAAFTRNQRRMINETERIQRTGFLNLMIGILFSVVALGILGYPLIAPNTAPATDWINIVERFAPRMSVGVLIQLIGFFFLRLYVAGENELHYIRNEITNLESRSISYNAAAVNNDKTAMKDLVAQLVRTERNFKLKKDERTLYRVDETYNDLGELLKEAMKVKRSKSNKT